MAILALALTPVLASYGMQGAIAMPEMGATGDTVPVDCPLCQEQAAIDAGACALICGSISAILPHDAATDAAATNVFILAKGASFTALSRSPELSPPRESS